MLPEAIFTSVIEILKLYKDLSPKIAGLTNALKQSDEMSSEQRTMLEQKHS